MRFEHLEEINDTLVLSYIKEAIENQKLGKDLKPERKEKKTIVPEELQSVFNDNGKIKISI